MVIKIPRAYEVDGKIQVPYSVLQNEQRLFYAFENW